MLTSLPNSSPGPNGIPFFAYKKFYLVTLPLFHSLIQDFLSPTGHEVPKNFNEALLYLLPKKLLASR